MTAFTEALKEYTRERVPLGWAALDDPGSVLAVKGTLRRFALLRDRFEHSILAMCGIPPALVAARGTGTAMRESFRQVLHSLLKPLGAILAEELREKLDPAAALDFSALRAGDITSTSRAFGSLVTAGLTPQSAATIVGLDDVEVSA